MEDPSIRDKPDKNSGGSFSGLSLIFNSVGNKGECFYHLMPQVRSLRYHDGYGVENVAFFYSLSRFFQLTYFVKCWRTLPEFKALQWPPTSKKNHKKGGFRGKFMAILCFISLIHTTWWDDIPRLIKSSFPSTVSCVFGCIFHLGVALNTEIWGS